MPALPGLGFSDPLPNSAPPISTTAKMVDTLMKRLGYPRYLVTNAGSASMSPAMIDWRIIKHLSQNYLDSCLGVHLISPPLTAPKLQDSTGEWTKWKLARLMSSAILGYAKEDFTAIQKDGKSRPEPKKGASPLGQLSYADCEPNTPAYALCDSPTGLLLYVLKILRTLGPRRELKPDDIITLTQLIWLPGPEAALRFWAHCAAQTEPVEAMKPKRKPKAAVTVFLGNEDQSEQQKALPRPAKSAYSCPGWAKTEFNVVHTNRVPGRPGFLSWDRPDIVVDGVRGLAKEILAVDNRMQRLSQAGIVPRPPIVDESESAAVVDLTGTTVQEMAGTNTQMIETRGSPAVPASKLAPQEGNHIVHPLTPEPSPKSQKQRLSGGESSG